MTDEERKSKEDTGFCTVCGYRVESFAELDTHKCPQCGTKSIPCVNSNQVNVSINIHELRVLCIWAERWVMEMPEVEQHNSAKTLRAIVARLTKQIDRPVALLLADEISGLRDAGLDVKTNKVEL